jgi:hypothetical protein
VVTLPHLEGVDVVEAEPQRVDDRREVGWSWWGASASPYSPNVVDHGDGWAVLVDYLHDPCPGWCPASTVGQTTEFGVAALAADDGHVLWKAPVIPAGPDTEPRARSRIRRPGNRWTWLVIPSGTSSAALHPDRQGL